MVDGAEVGAEGGAESGRSSVLGTRELLERDAELAHLDQACETLRAGFGTLTLVRAGPGLGKSSLLDAVATTADAVGGIEVLRAQGSELEQDFAFGGVRLLLEPALARLDETTRRRVLSGAAARAAGLLTAEGEQTDGHRSGDLPSVLHSLHWVVANLADRHPVLVLVDDLQWLDQPSRRFLLHLGRRIGDVAVAMVVASRPEEPVSDDGVQALRRLPAAVVLDLPPLSDAAVLALQRGGPAGATIAEDDFVRLVGGNPLVASQLLADADADVVSLRGSDDVDVGPSGLPVVEHLVHRSVEHRMRDLDASALGVLQAAALVEDGTAVEVVAAMAGVSNAAARRVVSGLADAALLAAGPTVTFAHPVVRAAVRDTVDPEKAAVVHERAVEVLLARQAPAEVVAPHLAASPPRADADRFRLLHDAGRRALSAGSPQAAVRWLRRASYEPPPPERRVALLTDLVRAEIGAREAPAWRTHLGELKAHGDDQERLAALARVGDALLVAGELAAAADVFRQGLALLDGDPTDSERHGDLHLRLVAGLAFAARSDPAARLERERALARVLAQPPAALTPGGRALLAQAAFEKARGVDEAHDVRVLAERSLAHEPGSAGLAPGSRPYLLVVLCLTFLDDWETAGTLLDRSVDAAARSGSVVPYTASLLYRARVRFHTGRITDALGDISDAHDAGRDLFDLDLPGLEATRALARLEAGDLAPDVLADLALPSGRAWDQGPGFDLWLLARSQARLAVDDVAGAAADAREAGRRRQAAGSENPATAPWRRTLALALHRSGDHRGAMALLEEELALARAFGAPRLTAVPLRLLGSLEQDRTAAVDHLEEALALIEPTPCALERAKVLLALGAETRRRGQPVAARTHLRRAVQEADAGGARAVADAARAELRLAGGRLRRAALVGPAALTPGERRVAELAADGFTNREVAQQLFVTVKTVEYHLGNAYGKLGVRSRRELPAALTPANA